MNEPAAAPTPPAPPVSVQSWLCTVLLGFAATITVMVAFTSVPAAFALAGATLAVIAVKHAITGRSVLTTIWRTGRRRVAIPALLVAALLTIGGAATFTPPDDPGSVHTTTNR